MMQEKYSASRSIVAWLQQIKYLLVLHSSIIIHYSMDFTITNEHSLLAVFKSVASFIFQPDQFVLLTIYSSNLTFCYP